MNLGGTVNQIKPLSQVTPLPVPEPESRVGVLDIGSNSVRLVVFEGGKRMPIPIFNEKALCALGADLMKTGRLSETGRISALVNIARFSEIAREMRVADLHVVATAAVRDAENGPAFAEELESRFGLKVRVLSGDEEAVLSAHGVVSAFPGADGIMGDLGGGSLEMVDVSAGETRRFASLPIGPQRLGALTPDQRPAFEQRIDTELRKLDWLGEMRGRPLYVVGGAWRSLAKAHMTHANYPLQVIHGYELGVDEALDYLDRVSGATEVNGQRIGGVSKRRYATVGLAALIMARVMRLGAPSRLVFSAFGLREGCLFDQLPADEKSADPLLASCSVIAGRTGRFPLAPDVVERWIRGFLPDLDDRDGRLIAAVSILADVGWSEHPRYRGEQAFLKVLRLPVVGIGHEDRAFVALAILARYQGDHKVPAAAAVSTLVPAKRRQDALRIGLALRLGLTLCGGVENLLSRLEVRPDHDWVTIAYPKSMAVLHGEVIGRRIDELARAIGMPIVLSPQSGEAENDGGRAVDLIEKSA
jgi:exopolyphosphatase/guanosine-5'-triphosphate,3'-diphosphate pyrophosphatase